MSRRTSARILLFALLAALFAPGCSAGPRPSEARPGIVGEGPAGRLLPLNRFRYSRSAETDAQGFYYQPAGLADDYPEETTTSAKIQRDISAIVETGSKVYRFAFGWDSIEEKPGEYNFLFWDEVVDRAARAGVTLIPYVCYTPRWLGTDPNDYWRQPPKDPSRFGRFMEVIVNRYKGKIHSWELWNEPDLEAYWLGTPEQFAQLVFEGAKGVRRADPSAVIVLGGIAEGRGPFYDTLLTKLGVGGAVDVVNVHGYLETWSDEHVEAYPARIEGMAALLPPIGLGPDLWMAEFGYSNYRFSKTQVSKWGIEIVYAYEHTPEYQAVALIKTHVLSLVPEKLSLTAWYRINDLPPSTGVIGDDNNKFLGILDVAGKPKPAFYALRFYNQLVDQPVSVLDSRVRVEKMPGSQSEVHVVERKDGHALLFGWLRIPTRDEVADRSGMAVDTRREVVSVTLPGEGYARMSVYDAQGRLTPSSAHLSGNAVRDVPLTGEHVFIADLSR